LRRLDQLNEQLLNAGDSAAFAESRENACRIVERLETVLRALHDGKGDEEAA
jgi:hypothetical protein